MTVWPRSCVWISFSSISLPLDKAVSWLWHQTLLFCRPKDKAQFSPFPFPPQVFSYCIILFSPPQRKTWKYCFYLSSISFPTFSLEPTLIRRPPPSLFSVSSMTFMLQRPSHLLIWPLGSHLIQLILETYLLTWLLRHSPEFPSLSIGFLSAFAGLLLIPPVFKCRLMKYIDVICPNRDKPLGAEIFFLLCSLLYP